MSVSGGYTMFPYLFISSVQSLSCVQLFVTPQTAAHQASLSITKSWGLLKLIEFYHYHRDGNAIQPSHPLSSPSPAFSLSQHQGFFQWVSSLHQVTKVKQKYILYIRGLQSCTFYLFLDVSCRILIPCSGIKPVLPAMEAQSPNHWINREVPTGYF